MNRSSRDDNLADSNLQRLASLNGKNEGGERTEGEVVVTTRVTEREDRHWLSRQHRLYQAQIHETNKPFLQTSTAGRGRSQTLLPWLA
jgi:hypothetical protein